MELITAWTADALVLVALAVSVGLYLVGWRRLSRHSRTRAGLVKWRRWSYLAGLAVLGVALLSPLNAYAGLLFSAHMAQHLLLLLIVPPLIWLGAPLVPLLWGLPEQERRGAARLLGPRGPLHAVGDVLTDARAATALYLGVTALWHVPALYDAAQGRSFVHDVEHVAFLGTGLLFWWAIIHPTGGRRRLGLGSAVFYLIPPLLLSNALGALLTFAQRPLYETYIQAPRVTSLSPLEDQQLGGLIMWVPGGMFWMIPLFIVLAAFLRHEDQIADQRVEFRVAPPAPHPDDHLAGNARRARSGPA